jgi:hypothetical protein
MEVLVAAKLFSQWIVPIFNGMCLTTLADIRYNYLNINLSSLTEHQQLTPVILATQETEIRRIMV